MTKRELIEEVVAAQPQLPRAEVEGLVNAVFDTLAGSLVRGERIEIRGFGSFVVKRREGRMGLNPKTGESMEVPAKHVPFFKAGKELRERVDAGRPDVVADAAPVVDADRHTSSDSPQGSD